MIYADISSYQGNVNWQAYSAWSKIVAIKATEGVGFTDQRFQEYRSGALAAGIERILYYHYGRPDLGNSAANEAGYMHSIVGPIRPQDLIMLDMEVASSADWSLQWLQQQENYGKLPVLYSYDSFIRTHLQDQRLTRYPLIVANYTYDANARPACPPPWKSYFALQFSDKLTVPGIAGPVDANIYLGGNISMSNIPQGWSDDGTTLTAPNGVKVVLGFRSYVLSHAWDAADMPLAPEAGVDPVEVGYSQPDGNNKGTRQIFMYSVLGYTPKRGVFQISVGREFYALLNQKPERPANVANALVQIGTIATAAKTIEALAAKAQSDLGGS
jgi:lysozyme